MHVPPDLAGDGPPGGVAVVAHGLIGMWRALAPDGSRTLLALAAAAGSMAGGAVGWWAAAQGWSWPLPLTTPRMHAAVGGWLEQGAAGIAHQPLSGVPYKVFVAAAPDAEAGTENGHPCPVSERRTR